MNEQLMRAVVDALVFFELSSDDIVNPDAAVEQIERISASLQQLSPVDREAFCQYIRQLADSEHAANGDDRVIDFLLSAHEYLGL